jgi:hypothetical protein
VGHRGGRDGHRWLLHPSPHVVDAGEPQPHHVERIEYPHRVRQPSRQRCTVAAARVQRRHFNPGGPLRGLVKEPVGQHFSAPPGNDVDEFSAMQVNDSGGKHGGLNTVGLTALA